MQASGPNPSEEEGSERSEQAQEDTRPAQGLDWFWIVVIIAAVVCVAAIVAAVVVLQKKPDVPDGKDEV